MLSYQSLTTARSTNTKHQPTLALNSLVLATLLIPSVADPATMHSVLRISSPRFDCKQLLANILLCQNISLDKTFQSVLNPSS